MKWKNTLIKSLLWAANPKQTRPSQPSLPQSILVVSTTGLGDTLWGTPAIRALRQSYPDSYIAALTSEIGLSVLEHNKNLDEVFALTSNTLASLLGYRSELKRKTFDTILIFHTSQRAILPFCVLLEPAQIIGTEGMHKDLDFLLTKSLKKGHEHEIARRCTLAKAAGAFVSDFAMEMPLQKEGNKSAERFLEQHGVPSHIPIIGIHPGAKNTFKQWPPHCFAEVGKRLNQHLGCQVIVSGDSFEALLVLEVASQIPGAIPIAGELPLNVFAALQKRMSLFITNDTGPMHLAFAANIPTVALFGPTDPHLCGPFHVDNVKVLSMPKTCTPCLQKKCAEPFCLLQIGPDAVYDAAVQLTMQPSCF